MDTTVAEFASKLLSDDPTVLANTAAALKEFNRTNPIGSPPFSRIVQEVAIYQQGSVIEELLRQILAGQHDLDFRPAGSDSSFLMATLDSEEGALAQISLLVLTFLASSKPVAHFVLSEEGAGERMMRFIMKKLGKRCSSDGASFQMPDPNLIPVLEGLVNFSRASKSFRQLMMQACDDLLPALQLLLSEKVARDTPIKGFIQIRKNLATLIRDLSYFRDSQGWMVEKGFLGLLAGICETEKYEQDENRGTFFCSVALLRLLESPDCVNKMTSYSSWNPTREWSTQGYLICGDSSRAGSHWLVPTCPDSHLQTSFLRKCGKLRRLEWAA
jgi:hypothetical protein